MQDEWIMNTYYCFLLPKLFTYNKKKIRNPVIHDATHDLIQVDLDNDLQYDFDFQNQLKMMMMMTMMILQLKMNVNFIIDCLFFLYNYIKYN